MRRSSHKRPKKLRQPRKPHKKQNPLMNQPLLIPLNRSLPPQKPPYPQQQPIH
jgi:hypothetical protein